MGAVSQVGMNRLFDISPFVSAALKDGRPVVALETTLVTLGLWGLVLHLLA